MDELGDYYRDRAPVYDRVYDYPERQGDLRFLEAHLPEIIKGRNVLEIAAGTGYWTQYLSRAAKSLMAIDREQAQLDILHTRAFHCPLETRTLDAYHVDRMVDEARSFNAAFAGLWISHVPKQRRNEFLLSVHQCLRPGARVVLIDNTDVQCQQFPIVEEDEHGNTYQRRCLTEDNCHRVLKNFPDLDELKAMTAPFGEFHSYIDLENFWLFQYTSG